jgi:hypothetical protein
LVYCGKLGFRIRASFADRSQAPTAASGSSPPSSLLRSEWYKPEMWASNSNKLMSAVTWTRGRANRLIFSPNPHPAFMKAQRKPACSASRKSRPVTVAELPKGYPNARTVRPSASSRTLRLSEISRQANASGTCARIGWERECAPILIPAAASCRKPARSSEQVAAATLPTFPWIEVLPFQQVRVSVKIRRPKPVHANEELRQGPKIALFGISEFSDHCMAAGGTGSV